MTARKRGVVLLAMSGGVDSSAAAAILQKRGFEVVGVTMQIWQESHPDPRHGGCCSLEYYAQLRAQRAIERTDVAIVVIDGAEGITHYDRRIAQLAADAGRGIVWAVNKWDLKEPPDGNLDKNTPLKKDFARLIQQSAKGLDYVPFVFISALAGAGIERLLDTCMAVADFHCMRVGTGELNRLIHEWLFERPYTRKGKTLKIYYATMASVRPPTMVLFVNDPEIVHFSYLRYLENQLRKRYAYTGVPIRWVVRAAHEEREK